MTEEVRSDVSVITALRRIRIGVHIVRFADLIRPLPPQAVPLPLQGEGTP